MNDHNTNAFRLEATLDRADPFDAAFNFAVEMRDSGMPQPELLSLFDASRARHQSDADQSRYDALVDVMDLIVGWCSPGRALFPHPIEGT